MDWREKVTEENSLWEVYRKARKIASSKANRVAALGAFLLLLALFIIDINFGLNLVSVTDMTKIVGQIGEIGFALTTAILGFLIAGFSIFSSITKPEIFSALAKLAHKDSGLSRLQFIFFNFLLVFIHYLAFLAFSIAIKIFLPTLMGAVGLAASHWAPPAIVIWGTAAVGTAIAISWLVFLIMLLKSFIWNIYQAILIVIVTGDLIAQIEKDAQSKPENKIE
jgi:hypothetical protein